MRINNYKKNTRRFIVVFVLLFGLFAEPLTGNWLRVFLKTLKSSGDNVIKILAELGTSSVADDFLEQFNSPTIDGIIKRISSKKSLRIELVEDFAPVTGKNKSFLDAVGESLKYNEPIVIENVDEIRRIHEQEVKYYPSHAKEFTLNLKEYIEARFELNSVFPNKKLLAKFDGDILNPRKTVPFKTSLEAAKQNLIPERLKNLRDSPEINDLYCILTGRKLNKDQARFLSKSTGRKFLPSTDKFHRHIYLEFKEGTFKLNTPFSSQSFDQIDSFSRQLMKYRNPDTRIIYDGEISPGIISVLRENNFKFVSDFDSVVRAVSQPPKRVKLIFVASGNDIGKMRELFPGVSPRDLRRLMGMVKKAIDKIPDAETVTSARELKSVLTNSNTLGESPVVVFNNIDNQLFNENISHLGISNAITCNSINIKSPGLSFRSTDVIYFPETVEALIEVYSREKISLEKFWSNFALKYWKHLKVREIEHLVVASTVAGTVVSAVYYVLDRGKE